jgi:nitroreductase
MEFYDVIDTRLSVRNYSDTPVQEQKLEQILECARWAPSWANKQCWSFIVVKNKDMIEALSKAGFVNKWLKAAPVIIVACANPELSGSRNGMDYYLVDVAIAMEHLILAAADQGLGSCWIGAFDEAKVKSLLAIPDHIRVVALTPIGYPAEKMNLREKVSRSVIKASKRKQLSEIVHYDHW